MSTENTAEMWQQIYQYDPAFLLRACESHDNLVKALQSARQMILQYMRGDALICAHGSIEVIDAALAKASS